MTELPFDTTLKSRLLRKLLNPYQLVQGRVGRGRDHWEFITGRVGATRRDAMRVLLARAVPSTLARLGKMFADPVGTPLPAEVNNNRWIVKCDQCAGGADVVDPDDPVFYCLSCHNVDNGGLPRPVTFPTRRLEIEAALAARPDPLTRHFLLHERLEDLHEQNRAHGLMDARPPVEV